MADVDLTPTAEMARNAARGLELRREHGRGGTEVGVARARDISNGKTLSPETVRRMHAFFSRHAKNKAGGEDDAGYIAWMLWGGDEGRDWASSKVDALDRKERNAMSETRKAIMERLGMAAGGEKQVFASSDDIMEMAQMLSAVESAVMHKRIEEAKSLLRKIQPIVERNRGSRELDAQGMVRAYNDYRRKLGMSRPGAKATMATEGRVKVDGVEYRVLPYQVEYFKSDLAKFDDPKWRKQVVQQYLAKNYIVRASRPGAKAKMDKNAAYIEYANLRETTSKLENRIARAPASDKPRLMAELAKQVQRMKELSQILRASRPGAKVRAALADACWDGYEAVGTKPQDGKTVPNCVPKATAAKDTMSAQQAVAMNVDRAEQAIARGDRDAARRHIKAAQEAMDDSVTAAGLRKRLEQLAQRYKMAKPAEGDLEREDVKAGLKLMAASDPAVSDKIRTLIKEGKPQDQAVAIALDMKRRGEL